MTENTQLLDDLYPIVRTQLEIIRDNGFILNTDEVKILESQDDSSRFVADYERKFLAGYEEKKYNTIYDMFNRRFIKPNAVDVFVYYIDPRIDKGKKINKPAINHLMLLVGTNMVDIFLITKTPLGPGATEVLQQLHYRHFLFSELQYNPLKSIFSPKYEILSDTERIEFLRNNIIDNPEKITKIKIDDKICRYYDLRIGQIIRITARIIFYESIVKQRMSYRIVTD
jgi:DNA-directed RNA polymerase subunit H (RpoH/RPB5)